MKIHLTDNNLLTKGEGIYKRNTVSDLFPYSNKTIAQLYKENQNLLIFPQNIEDTADKINEATIYSLDNTDIPNEIHITTGNLVGFFGINDIKIKIQSRFDRGNKDYLLHYLLGQVLSFNLFDLNHNNDEEEIFNFLLFMFPHCLKSALQQGIYKEYQCEERNDDKVKGSVDVSRFIRKDIPFSGRMAYTASYYSYDNSMTELIRHTIEYIKSKKVEKFILTMDKDVIDCVRSIIEVTPNYKRDNRNKVINENLRPKIHPYYTQYRPLQNLCLQILRREEIKYGTDNNEICGILFDAAWLWEEYLYKAILSHCGFLHPQNKQGKGAIYLFEKQVSNILHTDSRYKRYPDYIKSGFILDAKYKRLAYHTIDRDDMHQIISYMHVEKAKTGGFIYPTSKEGENTNIHFVGTLRGHGGRVCKIGFPIPTQCTSFLDFSSKMKEIEESLKNAIKNI